jgi:hypothetical protein
MLLHFYIKSVTYANRSSYRGTASIFLLNYNGYFQGTQRMAGTQGMEVCKIITKLAHEIIYDNAICKTTVTFAEKKSQKLIFTVDINSLYQHMM